MSPLQNLARKKLSLRGKNDRRPPKETYVNFQIHNSERPTGRPLPSDHSPADPFNFQLQTATILQICWSPCQSYQRQRNLNIGTFSVDVCFWNCVQWMAEYSLQNCRRLRQPRRNMDKQNFARIEFGTDFRWICNIVMVLSNLKAVMTSTIFLTWVLIKHGHISLKHSEWTTNRSRSHKGEIWGVSWKLNVWHTFCLYHVQSCMQCHTFLHIITKVNSSLRSAA